MRIDERQLDELTEASQDLHSDAMKGTRAALAEVVETRQDRRTVVGAASGDPTEGRRGFMRRSLFAAGTLGVGAGAIHLARAMTTVYADAALDVQMLQTAASIENLAVSVYNTALKLPASVNGSANPVIAKFVTTTIAQHTDHAKAFNAAISSLNGKPQNDVDQPVFTAVVTPALGGLKGPADVVGLALTLEDAAAQTYVKFAGDATDSKALGPLSAIAPVEAQHAAILRAVKALLDAGAPQLIALPPDLAALPAAAGSVGFPDAFYKTSAARPATEGAVP